MQKRVINLSDVNRREENGKLYLEGYFARFHEPYVVCEGWEETIAPGAFADCLASGDDVKALWNHNADIVLGCTGNRTVLLSETASGLFGSIEINRNDSDAMNAYARILRRDVSGCSFGFDAEFEDWFDENGIYHTRITRVTKLYEISPCTFPAYESTTIAARSRERLNEVREDFARRRRTAWRQQMRQELKG
ncbi:MAG: HK97 family phage prohead protease [Clostridia bacterium]|nr:HK97 family phage prohead protease [Clostridia bacterium]